jgi:hypothetical protein
MRRAATLLVAAGVILLVGLAAVEALRGDDAEEADPARGSSLPGLPDRLEEAGVTGLLYLSTRRGTECAIQAVRLPSLAVESEVPAPDCRFAVASNGLIATGFDCDEPGALLRPDDSVVDVERFDGCAPAWKPSGELTFLRDGAVMEVPPSCTGTINECASAVLRQEDLQRGLPELVGGRPWEAHEIAWLDETTVAAVISGTAVSGGSSRTTETVRVFAGTRPAAAPSFGQARLFGLVADRAGRRFLVSGEVIQGVFLLDERGRFVNTLTVPGIPEVASVAVSPDGSWTAAAGRASVVVFQPGDPPGPSFQLPFAAEAVAWPEP